MAELDSIVREELKQAGKQLKLAREAKTISEMASYLREAYGIKERYPKIRNFQNISKIVAAKLLEEKKITFPKRKPDLEKEIDSVIFAYREILNGLVGEEELRKGCFWRLTKLGYAQIYKILNDLSTGEFDMGFLSKYYGIKLTIKELKGKDEQIEIEGENSDKFFYKLMLTGMITNLKNKGLGTPAKYGAGIRDYSILKEGFKRAFGWEPLILTREGDVLLDSVFYMHWGNQLGFLAGRLKQEAKEIELEPYRVKKEEAASKISEYRSRVLGKVQDSLYGKAEEAGEEFQRNPEKAKKDFGIAAKSYIFFTQEFYHTLEETREEAVEAMKELETRYFKAGGKQLNRLV